MTNPLIEVQKFGQSIWYDNIRRGLLTSGELRNMVDNDGLLGVTSNPAIFEKALAGSADYDEALKKLVDKGVGGAKPLYEDLAVEDIQRAADVLRPVYETTEGRDGYVSFEVSPYLASNTQATVEEARRLRAAIARDNVMIKVPATPEGILATAQLIGEGININVTLLFALEAYEATADAYLKGLEQLGGDLSKVASVASFFLSRIDTLVDEEICTALGATRDKDRRAKLKSLLGKVAIANAKLAYTRYQDLFVGARWKALAAKGARTQRLLWASTSTKNPKYPKTMYVDELIGPDTVNTVPTETLGAFREQGRVRQSLTENVNGAHETMKTLAEVGISMEEVTASLLDQGVNKFSAAFDKLLGAVEHKRQAILGGELAHQTYEVGDAGQAVKATLHDWRINGKVRRLWNGDASLWTGMDENEWLGWLHVVDGQCEHAEPLERIAQDVRKADFRHVVLLGMGGSSLCPWVLRQTFGKIDGFPQLQVLDSIVPAQVKSVERGIDLKKTLFVVASKSGTTTEPNVLQQYFMDKVQHAGISDGAGSRFIAVTDPGTKLHKLAKRERFRHICHGEPNIGGRYSAFSSFGTVPAALMGLDVSTFLENAEIMVQSCAAVVPPEANPGVVLGVVLGTMAQRGRDKVTLITSPAIESLGAWLEQLIAESTGKQGKGLVPVAEERPGPAEVYGTDRVFVYVREKSSATPEQDASVNALQEAGHPVVRISLEEPMDLGQEFFRWEIATAVAGSILGINPFNQPDVEASKIATKNLTEAYEEKGELPAELPLIEDGTLRLFADPRNAEALGGSTLEACLSAHLARVKAGDYFAVNAYLEQNQENHNELQAIRHAVRDAKRAATTLGYGPRFLHSTGQLHKGGPNTGVFLQITSDDAEDIPIPGRNYSFGILKRAQAQGDFEVLAERQRRLLRVHLGPDVVADLARLRETIHRAVLVAVA